MELVALQTLEPLTGALDIIRYFGTLEEMTAETSEIQRSLGLSDRSFDKAIRRLVTKGYVQMDGSRVYRLTEQGQRAVEELAAYDQSAPDGQKADVRAAEGIARA
jgi:Mn-dependent DtxR family transcriptional regulator